MATRIIGKKFMVTITEVDLVELDTTETAVAEERHYTDEEIQESHRWMGGSESKEKYMKKIYKDVISVAFKTNEKKVFEQTVSELDIRKVVNAVNEGIIPRFLPASEVGR